MGEEGFKQQPFLKPPQWALVAAVIGSLAITSFGVFQLYRLKQSNSQANTQVAATPPKITAISALGRLEPQGEVIKLSASGSTSAMASKIDQLLVEQGDTVKKGQVIAILDSRDRLQASVEKAKQQVKVAEANLAQVKAGAKSGEIAAQQAEISKLELQRLRDIETQKAEIARLTAQRARALDANRAQVALFKAQLQNAQTECQRYDQLLKEGAVTASNRDTKCLQRQTVQEQLNEAQANLRQTDETTQEQLIAAKATLNRIQGTGTEQLNSARATLNQIAEVRSVDVQAANAEINSAIASLKQAQAELDLAYVRSPINGQILKINTRSGETVSSEGIVEIGKTSQMYVVAEVYESDIDKINKGKTAEITSKGFNWTLKGSVVEKGLKIAKKDVLDTDPAADVDARIVEVKIRLDPKDSAKVAGLTNLKVEVKIDI